MRLIGCRMCGELVDDVVYAELEAWARRWVHTQGDGGGGEAMIMG